MSDGYQSDDQIDFQLFNFLDPHFNMEQSEAKIHVTITPLDKLWHATHIARDEIIACLRGCFTMTQATTLFIRFECISHFASSNSLMRFKTQETAITADTTKEALMDMCRHKAALLDYKISNGTPSNIAHVSSFRIYIYWYTVSIYIIRHTGTIQLHPTNHSQKHVERLLIKPPKSK